MWFRWSIVVVIFSGESCDQLNLSPMGMVDFILNLKAHLERSCHGNRMSSDTCLARLMKLVLPIRRLLKSKKLSRSGNLTLVLACCNSLRVSVVVFFEVQRWCSMFASLIIHWDLNDRILLRLYSCSFVNVRWWSQQSILITLSSNTSSLLWSTYPMLFAQTGDA